jgi:NitT/TauT family transport system permease protein/putative hydroxymethylpyrimidine transport system permease protein
MLRRVALPALLLGLLLLAWQAVVWLGFFDPLTLASPGDVVRSFRDDNALLFDEAGTTALEMVAGLAIAIVLGVALAVVMHLVRPLRDATYPLLLASQAAPVVVLAPIIVIAFGFGIASKIVMVVLICFFPITISVLGGLGQVDDKLLMLLRSLGASRLVRLWKAELPSALPSLFTGLRLAATFSAIGAVFGEWAGGDHGLGLLVLRANNQLQTPRVYAGTVLLTAMALVLFVFVSVLERVTVPWKGKT